MAYQRKKLRLGDLLLSRGVITEDQLEYALSEQKKMGLKLGETLIRLGFVNQEQINNFICEQLDIDYEDVKNKLPDPDEATNSIVDAVNNLGGGVVV